MPSEWQLAWVKVRRIKGLQGGHEELVEKVPVDYSQAPPITRMWLRLEHAALQAGRPRK